MRESLPKWCSSHPTDAPKTSVCFMALPPPSGPLLQAVFHCCIRTPYQYHRIGPQDMPVITMAEGMVQTYRSPNCHDRVTLVAGARTAHLQGTVSPWYDSSLHNRKRFGMKCPVCGADNEQGSSF